MGEVVDGFKSPCKKIFGGMARIGAGALIGVALRYIPRDQLGPIAKLCAGIGISGLALYAGKISDEAICDSVDKTFAGLEVLEAIADGINEAREKTAAAGTTEEDSILD